MIINPVAAALQASRDTGSLNNGNPGIVPPWLEKPKFSAIETRDTFIPLPGIVDEPRYVVPMPGPELQPHN